jgi:hypothetical protein
LSSKKKVVRYLLPIFGSVAILNFVKKPCDVITLRRNYAANA